MTPYYEDTKSGIVIYHGDCREILPSLEADFIFTDPPYGHNNNGDLIHRWEAALGRPRQGSCRAREGGVMFKPKIAMKVLRCPFCGITPNIQPWHGGKKTKRLISCDNDNCQVQPAVTGETAAEAYKNWQQVALIRAAVKAALVTEAPMTDPTLIREYRQDRQHP